MRDIASRANDKQARASNPTVSAWVSANAGSGKTHVLVNRVIRLMLTGTPPEKILCLTYTRAAAAEMSNRLYKNLAEWIPLDDDALIDKIHKNTGHIRFEKDQLAAPRRLFAKALETPGGLKIQTIHAFCEQLLHRFPLEAGVTSGFTVMEDRQANDLLGKVRSEFFAAIEQSNDYAMRGYLAEVVKFSGGEKTFGELLEKLLDQRDKLTPVYLQLDEASKRLAAGLGIDPDDTVKDIKSKASSELDRSALKHALSILEAQTNNKDKAQATVLAQLLQTSSDRVVFEKLQELFLTAKAEPKSRKNLCSADCVKKHPDVFQTLEKEADRFTALFDKFKAINILRATDAALHVGKVITSKYEAEKNRLGLYDYQDLIAKVLVMFAQMPDAAWVLYKLDGGLDHILIDEAQDTSPAQWDIVQFLADDFFSGVGARQSMSRSIFAVGDRKQSIYSFQGADPESFDQRKRHFQQAVELCGQQFEAVEFDVSFRSTEQVLDVVDRVFAQSQAVRGVGETDHLAHRHGQPGIVELWPLEEKMTPEKKPAWVPGDGETGDSHARIKLAKKIALKIKGWLDSGEILASENRPIRPGDILILVRRRTQLMAALVRALKQADIPIAGVDRLKLTQHIAVQDLMALARFALLPQDDLNFAGLLKSSLLEKDNGKTFNDEDLILLAADRGECSLWSSFLRETVSGGIYDTAKTLLLEWQERARRLLPFEFFSSVLNTDKKRWSILQRLGSEAGEPIDAFLALTQDYERTSVPTLQGFLSWVESGDTEIKREMEKNDNEVRIMTVHGAKGLEAKIVIMPDSYDVPDGKNVPKLLYVDDATPMWKLTGKFETPLTSALKNRHLDDSNEELNRLLYVAMTRACDRLYIGGAQSRNKIKENSWYKLVENILCRPEHETPDPVFGKVWKVSRDHGGEEIEKNPAIALQPPAPVPVWANEHPASGSHNTDWVAPSQMGTDKADNRELYLSPLAAVSKNRFQRGNLIHKMLQHLPEVPPERQKEVAEHYIFDQGSNLSKQERLQTLAETLTILTDEKFAPVFGPGSVAEAPIVARIKMKSGSEMVLNGQIDRLKIGDSKILIVDYKTNRPAPATANSVNRQYIRQLAAYRLALLEIYPEHTIQAALLWTHSGVLMEIDEKQLIDVFST